MPQLITLNRCPIEDLIVFVCVLILITLLIILYYASVQGLNPGFRYQPVFRPIYEPQPTKRLHIRVFSPCPGTNDRAIVDVRNLDNFNLPENPLRLKYLIHYEMVAYSNAATLNILRKPAYATTLHVACSNPGYIYIPALVSTSSKPVAYYTGPISRPERVETARINGWTYMIVKKDTNAIRL